MINIGINQKDSLNLIQCDKKNRYQGLRKIFKNL